MYYDKFIERYGFVLLNINFWFGLKPVFFCLYFEHDINVVSNDVHIINIESMRNIS